MRYNYSFEEERGEQLHLPSTALQRLRQRLVPLTITMTNVTYMVHSTMSSILLLFRGAS
jgi:hypothetical protein